MHDLLLFGLGVSMGMMGMALYAYWEAERAFRKAAQDWREELAKRNAKNT